MTRLGWLDSDCVWLTRQIVEVAERHAEGRIVSMLEGEYELSVLARAAG